MSDPTVGEQPTVPEGGDLKANWQLIGLFTVVTLVGIVLASKMIETGFVATPDEQATDVVVPLFIYLYATFGALGYVFTKLMLDIRAYDERDELADLIGMSMRIPAAWVLATGFFLVTVQAGLADPVDDPYVLATIAFLVGLYVNVAMKSLGSLADRMLGRVTKGDAREGKPTDTEST